MVDGAGNDNITLVATDVKGSTQAVGVEQRGC